MMRTGHRSYWFLRSVVIWLPALLFLSALALPWIPGATGLFSDSAAPWYQPITSPLFITALGYSYPVTFLCTRLVSDDMFFSPGYFAVLAVYTVLWILLLRSAFSFFARRSLKPSS
jgi:hypothetical protein